MQVKVRYIQASRPTPFTEIDFLDLDALIQFVKESGGIYCFGNDQPFHSYQLVLEDDGSAAYAELIVGDEEDAHAGPAAEGA